MSLTLLGAGSVGAGDPYAAYLVYDTFTDVAGTNLTAHTPEKRPGANAWVSGLGTWQSDGDEAVLAATAGDHQNVVQIDAGDADVTVEADVIVPATFDFRVVVNYVDINNFWMGMFSQVGWTLYRRTAGAFTNIDSSPEARGAGSYTLRLVTSDDIITFFIDAAQKTTQNIAGRPHKTATRHGLSIFGTGDGGSRCTTFRVAA